MSMSGGAGGDAADAS